MSLLSLRKIALYLYLSRKEPLEAKNLQNCLYISWSTVEASRATMHFMGSFVQSRANFVQSRANFVQLTGDLSYRYVDSGTTKVDYGQPWYDRPSNLRVNFVQFSCNPFSTVQFTCNPFFRHFQISFLFLSHIPFRLFL